MKYFCIADEYEMLTGMRLVGVPGVLAVSERQVEAALNDALVNPDIAVLLITEACYALCRGRVDELRLLGGPPLVSIISPEGENPASSSLRELIGEALGLSL